MNVSRQLLPSSAYSHSLRDLVSSQTHRQPVALFDDVLDRFAPLHAEVKFCFFSCIGPSHSEQQFLASCAGFHDPSEEQFAVLHRIGVR
jgi:hypothetical protein